jgi:hypothetical protein
MRRSQRFGCVAVVVEYSLSLVAQRQRYPEKMRRTLVMQSLFKSRRAAAAQLEG